jgi:hypothetical protein
MVGFEMIGNLFVDLTFEDLRKAGWDRYRSVAVWIKSVCVCVSPLKRGMTAAAFQSLGISDDTKERLNMVVIEVATISADNFRKKGSRLSSPADL